MPATPKMIVRDLRGELALTNPDYRAAGRMIADALELLDRRMESVEKWPAATPEEPQVRHAEAPEVRVRRKK